MADIELVIRIDKVDYRDIKNKKVAGDLTIPNVFDAIRNGRPLPKGHGRLGDLDALREEVSSWGMNDYEPSDFTDEIDMADVIIEADRAESEEQE